ncbi:ABC transporter ATP-binding protein [Azospirillum sp. Marseille-Q6669]
MTATLPLLEVRGLRTELPARPGALNLPLNVLDGVSFSLGRGRILGLVGESGSGKSATAFSIMGLLDPPARVAGGSIRFAGRELAGLPERELRRLRGNRIAMIFQDPMMTLNPVLTIGAQIVETVLAHARVGRAEARRRGRDALGRVGVPGPEERLDAHPHELSGGLRQRVAIAIALLHEPDLIFADEPTTALDATIQAQILREIRGLVEGGRTAVLWITHDLSVAEQLSDEIAVMYAGRIVEQAPAAHLLSRPAHPYTAGLLASLPRGPRGNRLTPIPGLPPTLSGRPAGCAFRPRCAAAMPACAADPPWQGRAGGLGGVRCLKPGPEGSR